MRTIATFGRHRGTAGKRPLLTDGIVSGAPRWVPVAAPPDLPQPDDPIVIRRRCLAQTCDGCVAKAPAGSRAYFTTTRPLKLL